MQQLYGTGETVRDSQQLLETVKDMKQLYRSLDVDIVRDNQQPLETVIDMQQLHRTGRESERQPATMRNIERHVATSLDPRDSERQPATIGDS